MNRNFEFSLENRNSRKLARCHLHDLPDNKTFRTHLPTPSLAPGLFEAEFMQEICKAMIIHAASSREPA